MMKAKPGMPLAVKIAKRTKTEKYVKAELGGICGSFYNKFLAKIASDYRKPDGFAPFIPTRLWGYNTFADREFLKEN